MTFKLAKVFITMLQRSAALTSDSPVFQIESWNHSNCAVWAWHQVDKSFSSLQELWCGFISDAPWITHRPLWSENDVSESADSRPRWWAFSASSVHWVNMQLFSVSVGSSQLNTDWEDLSGFLKLKYRCSSSPPLQAFHKLICIV